MESELIISAMQYTDYVMQDTFNRITGSDLLRRGSCTGTNTRSGFNKDYSGFLNIQGD